MPEAYEGNAPYIFISYAHKDTDAVLPVIEALQANGFFVWYDGGIEAGSEWPEYIASHLENCECVLTFISENFIDSPNCRRELNFAQNLRKEILNIFIDDAKLTAGMQMQLGLNQALFKNRYKSSKEFHSAICKAQLLKHCKATATSVPQDTVILPVTKAEETTVAKTEANADKKLPLREKLAQLGKWSIPYIVVTAFHALWELMQVTSFGNIGWYVPWLLCAIGTTWCLLLPLFTKHPWKKRLVLPALLYYLVQTEYKFLTVYSNSYYALAYGYRDMFTLRDILWLYIPIVLLVLTMIGINRMRKRG